MAYFPVMMELENEKVLVIGGGTEGRKKVEILHEFGARITLIAPAAEKGAVEKAENYIARDFRDSDITDGGYKLIVAATNDESLNQRISSAAKQKGIPVNVVDDVKNCTFIFPAIVKEKDVVCSVSSGGKSPYVAQYVKSLITNVLPSGIGEINDKMGEYRKTAKERFDKQEERREFLKTMFEELLNKT